MGICASIQVKSAAEQAHAAVLEPGLCDGNVDVQSATDVKVHGRKHAIWDTNSLSTGRTQPAAQASACNLTSGPVTEGSTLALEPPAAAAGEPQVHACAGISDELAGHAELQPPAAPQQMLPGNRRAPACLPPPPPAAAAPGGSAAEAAAVTAMPAATAAPEAAMASQQAATGAVDCSLPCTMQPEGSLACNAAGSQTVTRTLPLGAGSTAALLRCSAETAEHPQSSAGTPADASACPRGGSSSSSSISNGCGRGSQRTHQRGRVPGRSQSSLHPRARCEGGGASEDVQARQADALRASKLGKLRQRRGGLDSSFAAMQAALATDEKLLAHVNTRAAGLKHIGFGPFKRENQDEFYIQIGEFGGLHSSNLFCVFDGHGTHGKDAALYSRQLLPRLLDAEVARYCQRAGCGSDDGLKGAMEVLISEAFGETERSVCKCGVNLVNSGTTASVAYQQGNRLWVASAGDSRAILCSRLHDQWRPLPLTIDHRPRRYSERKRIEAAGARVAPKRLPSGRTVGEPRMWLQDAQGPGLLLSRSLGDLTAASVGCTSDPEVAFTTMRAGVDALLVLASDGVWDVLSNEAVCDIVVDSPDPHTACRRVLDAALYEWEERMSADNITVLVVEFDWGEEGSPNIHGMGARALARSSSSSSSSSGSSSGSR